MAINICEICNKPLNMFEINKNYTSHVTCEIKHIRSINFGWTNTIDSLINDNKMDVNEKNILLRQFLFASVITRNNTAPILAELTA